MNPLETLENKVGQQPWYVWAGALTGGGIVVWYVLKNRAAKAAAASSATPSQLNSGTSNASLNGYDVSNIAGLPYGTTGYTSDSGMPVDNYPGGFATAPSSTSGTVPIVPPGETPIYDSSGSLVGWQNPGSTPAPTPTPTPTPTPAPSTGQEEGLVRARYNSATTKAYDTAQPAGVPIRSSPSGQASIVGYAQYASEVKITGAPVTGASNLGQTPANGSELWFPVTGGYISGYDLVGFFTLPNAPSSTGTTGTTGHGSGGFTSVWQEVANVLRGTVDQLATSFDLNGGSDLL